MAIYTDIDSFFSVGSTVLGDNYYTTHNKSCGICQEQEVDVPPTALGNSISSSSVIKVNSCEHIFHKICLQTWLISTRSNRCDATCPMCRALLVAAPHSSLEIDRLANEMRESHQVLVGLLNDLLSTTVDEAYEYAQHVVTLAATVDERMGVTTMSESISGLTAYIDEYEALQVAQPNGVGAWMWRVWQRLSRLGRGTR
jgi:hypothetical protein